MTTNTDETWWSRPSGGREVLQVAAPLVVSALSWTVMTFVDRVFLKHVSGDAMAAAFSAGTIWFLVVCLPLGICTYASTFVSQYFGAGQHERIGPATWQGVWVGIGFSPLLLACIPLAPALFAWAAHGETIVPLEIEYFQFLMWGAPAMLVAQALSSFYSGRGQTRVVMVVDCAFAGVNLVLDYWWIFGGLGVPAMGVRGAALATVAALWLKAFAYAYLVLQPKYRDEFGTLSGFRVDGELLKRLLKFGGPSGLQMLLDVMGWSVFILMIGRLGELESQATAIAISISSLAFMPVWGMSLATSILVGQRLGEDRDDLAVRAAWTTLALSLIYMTILSLSYALAPGLFLASFFTGNEATTSGAPLYGVAARLLLFVAAYNLFDAVLMIFAGAIKGAGDTQYVLYVSLIMGSLLATLSYLAVTTLGFGLWGCWGLLTTWVCVTGVAFFVRFVGGKWRDMRVIEPAVV